MSTTANPFELQIRFLHVPDALVGIPLPAEVVSATGSVQPVVLTVAEDQPVTTQVSAPGRYLVRAELPSGRWVAQAADVPENPATPKPPSATATLDLEVPAPAAKPTSPTEPHGSWLKGAWKTFGYRFGKLLYAGPEFPRLRLEFGWFEKWGEASAEGIDLVLRQDAAAMRQVDLPGSVALHPHPGWVPGWVGDRLQVRPLFVYCRTLNVEAASGRPLLIWPPAEGDQPLKLEVDDKNHNPDAPPLLAAMATGDRTVDALFAYIGVGALASARQASEALLAKAEFFLQEKEEDPVRACLAAYTLMRVGAIKHPQWLANLANRFTHLPDGDVVYAWYLLRDGDSESARRYFHSALTKGVPMYSEGVRLLRDGLNFVSGLFADDAEVKADAVRANALAGVANLESKLTCLSVGKRLRVDWS